MFLSRILNISFLACLFIACGDDAGSDCSSQTQAIAITVEGESMSDISGTVDVSDDRLSIDIDGTSANNATIFFSCPNEVGEYDLNFSLSSDAQTVTAFVPAESLNVILSTGCIQVVSVSDQEVVMRFNIAEDQTSINGQITLDVN